MVAYSLYVDGKECPYAMVGGYSPGVWIIHYEDELRLAFLNFGKLYLFDKVGDSWLAEKRRDERKTGQRYQYPTNSLRPTRQDEKARKDVPTRAASKRKRS